MTGMFSINNVQTIRILLAVPLKAECFFNSVIYPCGCQKALKSEALDVYLTSLHKSQMITTTRSGYRSNSNGSLGNGGSNGNYWRSSPNSVTNGNYLNFNSGNWNVNNNNNNRANGFPVCPVQALKIAVC